MLTLERFLADGRDAAIVVEDDILLDDRFLARAVSAMEAAPDADVIKLFNHRWKGFLTFTTTRRRYFRPMHIWATRLHGELSGNA